jgi:poly-gamma-glutamate synthesis protein (capsule biosynthesis protein)
MITLLFLGDIALSGPFKGQDTSATWRPQADLVLANLEGPVVSAQELRQLKTSGSLALYNSPDVLQALAAFDVTSVCLANNHIYDLPLPAAHTEGKLLDAGVEGFGAGASLAEASSGLTFTKNETKVKIFAFGWPVIGCRPATPSSEGVNPLIPKHMFENIRSLRATDESSFVVYLTHWNYELELHPQPAHRQLAFDLIDAGVDAVVGMHPHVAQGAESVNGKPVVFSLGNWFFPVRELGNLRLVYPSISTRQLALELRIEERQVRDTRFHWYRFDQDRNDIHYNQTEDWNGTILQRLTPFSGMSHGQYKHWFRANRNRRMGLPVYKDYRQVWSNHLRDSGVKLRQALIKTLVNLKIKTKLTQASPELRQQDADRATLRR